MNAAERALLRERIKLANILEQEKELAVDEEYAMEYKDYIDGLRNEIQEIAAAMKLLKEAKTEC